MAAISRATAPKVSVAPKTKAMNRSSQNHGTHAATDDPTVANLVVLAATELTTDADIAALCAALAEELQ